MIYPPPPGLALLAYQFGSISKEELEWCLKKWNEMHSTPPKEET